MQKSKFFKNEDLLKELGPFLPSLFCTDMTDDGPDQPPLLPRR